MKKKYFEVLISSTNNDSKLVAICETLYMITNADKTKTYVFRDLITQKVILPSHSHISNADCLTYDNYAKENICEISIRKVLNYLKSLSIEDIDMHYRFFYGEEKSLGIKKVRSNN